MVRRCRRSISSSAAERLAQARSWLLEFLERDGLGVLLDSLERLGHGQHHGVVGAGARRGCGGLSSMADISSQIECVACTRAVINSGVGLEYMVGHPAHTRQLASILSSQNTTVKLQVFELLCAICMFSPSGHALALDALQHFKNLRGHRYRFDAVILELRTAETAVYQTVLLCFVNCLVMANQGLAERTRTRSELMGSGLGQLLAVLRTIDSNELQIQVGVFDDAAHADQDALEELGAAGDPLHMSHHQLFDTIFSKVREQPIASLTVVGVRGVLIVVALAVLQVADTPQSLALHSVLLNLSQLDPSNTQSRKLKTLNWTKIPNQVIGRESVWSELPNVEPRVHMDFHQIEELFCQKQAAPAESKAGKKANVTASASHPTLVNLLDSKRSLAVNIFLKQFRSASSEIIDAIKCGDSAKLGAERLQGLQRLLPDKTELELIKSHPKDGGPLGSAEQFFSNLANVPSYPVRIEALLQKEQLPTTVAELKPQLQTVINICDQVINNASLKEFLALILQFGNYLNAGSYAGSAAGFKLNTLPKLLDMRTNKPRFTCLHYVVEVAEEQNKDILKFTTEMKQMRSAARISMEALEEEVQALANKINKLNNFVSEAMSTVKDLQICMSEAKKAAQRLASHFCEDLNGSAASRFQLQECFKLFADFFDKVDQVRVENEQRKKQEERAAARKKAEEAKQALEAATGPEGKKDSKGVVKRKPRGKTVLEADEPCLVDRLMQEIRGGTFKLRRTVPAGQA
ncbi:hypothetical protein FOCC_FOCC003999 [Frankliniella occidentalis]|nr:hypothetical protein FOCC_FOCC003999 [Frankliniella occidentalis]